MNREFVLNPKNRKRALIVLIVCVILLTAAVIMASRTQQDFGRVAVTDVYYPNANGISIRAKLFIPVGASRENLLPGVVYLSLIHI